MLIILDKTGDTPVEEITEVRRKAQELFSQGYTIYENLTPNVTVEHRAVTALGDPVTQFEEMIAEKQYAAMPRMVAG